MRFLDVLVLMMRWWGKFRRGRKRRRSAGVINIIVCGARSVDDGIMDYRIDSCNEFLLGFKRKDIPSQSWPIAALRSLGAPRFSFLFLRVQTGRVTILDGFIRMGP